MAPASMSAMSSGLSSARNCAGVMPATPSQAIRSAPSRLVGARGLRAGSLGVATQGRGSGRRTA
jgi:hypothetical protein